MRCFIAIDMPKKVREEIFKVQKQLPDVNMKKVDYNKAHLTLKFLGELGQERVDKVKSGLESIKMRRFKVRTTNLGVFTPDFIKVVWLGLEGEGLKKLKSGIEEKVKVKPKEDREFHPHVTIARVNNLKGMDRREYMRQLNEIKVNSFEFEVDRVKLKKSTLGKEGPEYEDLFVKKLSPYS